ncbi:glycine, alanine and asparagine-rich protein-like isoform X1 [Lucilia cuprina]|uniref:glycine, alanine and asparagine-rich protein-like isoform X1 n=1 Tax=Lucilia cuprina TaxID=7375 RepID=UPI001F0561DD|nr:glycine, alanine and asparagine-rich protein-like isoform X1 [Lucilia cuprina]
MRAFIVLCLVAVACAEKLGYNYQPVGHSDSGLSFTPGSGVGGSLKGGSLGGGSLGGGSLGGGSLGGGSLGGGSLGGGSLGGGLGGVDFGSSSNVAPSYAPQGDFSSASHDAPSYAPQAEFEKEFFTYTANDEDFHDPAASNQLANSVKQGLRVVFIKGPEHSGLEDAAVALAKHAAEQKTDIYVLQKQADLSSLANKLNTANKNTNNKPEVHFVKYRTPEDAVNAQKAIQGQYDTLGGSSKSHDGGVAPVLNFASQAPAPVSSHHSAASAPAATYSSGSSAPAASYSSGASAPAASYSTSASAPESSFSAGASSPSSSYIPPAPVVDEPSNTYLPASILRLFRL